MLICNRCGNSIPDGARFCPACGDPVTTGDLARKQAVPGTESVKLVCPHCERRSLFTVPSNGVDQPTCPACANSFETHVVRVRAKRSVGNKQANTRSFSVRVETLDGHEQVVEFIRPLNVDFELRSKDLAAFSYVHGRLAIVQNLSVGQHLKLARPAAHAQPGCAGAILLWLSAAAAAGTLAL
jgi:zinc-ribbon domain